MRKIAKLLLIALCFSLLCSCGSQTVQEEIFDMNFGSSESENSLDLSGVELDFAVIIDQLTNMSIEGNVLGYTQDTLFAEQARNRIAEVEKQLNCTIVLDNKATANNFNLESAAGSSYCDIIMCNSNDTQKWAKTGFLTGLSTLSEFIDFKDSDKWGNSNLLEVAFYVDDVYGVIPAAWPELSYVSFGYPLVANVDLINSLGVADPREHVEKDEWNWDQFKNELVECTVNTGTETVYGMITHYPYMAQMFIRSNGVTFAQKNDDGSVVCGYYTDAGIRALEYINEIYNGEYSSYILKDGHQDATISMEHFVNGLGCYTFTPAHCIFGVSGDISTYMENYAVLPTPYGPDVDPGYNGGLYHSQYYFVSIPKLSDINDAAAIVVNAIFEPFEGLETYENIKEYMARNYFFDKRDADWFFEMRNNASLNYDYQTGFLSRKIPEEICTSNTTVTELLEKYKDQMNTVIEETVTPMLSVYDVIWN